MALEYDHAEEEFFRDSLMPGEKIEWCGRPITKKQWGIMDFIFFIPISIVGTALTFLLIYLGITKMLHGSVFISLLCFGASLIPLIFAGSSIWTMLKMSGGGFLKNNYYAITNKRVISLNTRFGREIKSMDLDKITETKVTKLQRDGSGNLIFYDMEWKLASQPETDEQKGERFMRTPNFLHVPDVDYINIIVNRIRKRLPDDSSGT